MRQITAAPDSRAVGKPEPLQDARPEALHQDVGALAETPELRVRRHSSDPNDGSLPRSGGEHPGDLPALPGTVRLALLSIGSGRLRETPIRRLPARDLAGDVRRPEPREEIHRLDLKSATTLATPASLRARRRPGGELPAWRPGAARFPTCSRIRAAVICRISGSGRPPLAHRAGTTSAMRRWRVGRANRGVPAVQLGICLAARRGP